MKYPLYVVNVEAAIYKDNKWLLTKRSLHEDHAPGIISLIGGKVDTEIPTHNVLEETLKREIIEEVGIEVYDECTYVHSSSFIATFGKHVIYILFLCRYKSGEPQALDPDELESVNWMTLEEVLESEKIPVWTKDSLKLAETIRKKQKD